MTKHILGQAIWQCIILFTFLFAGEYLIPESHPDLIYEKTGNTFPGRADDWDGNPLWTREMTSKHGASRHLTFIFSSFVLMQIANMLCCRKIFDEWNFLEGIHKNFIFIGVWFVIIVGQVLITQFGSTVFVVSNYGLNGA
jgi:magnesium-transporting ATPase (P-type)